jgi:hypothetical protein
MFGMVFSLVRPLAAGVLFVGYIAAQLVTLSGFLMRDTKTEVTERKANGE